MGLLHAALFLAMSLCIPGHCALLMALAVISVSWWAACSTSRASAWEVVGLIIFSLCNPTGPMMDSFNLLSGVAVVLLNPGLQLLPVLCCDRWRQRCWGWWG